MLALATVAAFAAPPDRELARQLWLQGLDQESVFADDSAIALYRRATRADPEYLPAWLDHLRVQRWKGNPRPFIDEVQRRSDLSAAQRRCLVSVARIADDISPTWIDRFKAMRRTDGSTPCVLYGLARTMAVNPTRRVAPQALELEAARQVATLFPGHSDIASAYLGTLDRFGRHAEAVEAAAAQARAAQHAIHRFPIRAFLVQSASYARDSVKALVLYREMERDARADGRPGAVHRFLVFNDALAPAYVARREAFKAEMIAIARAARDRVPYLEVADEISRTSAQIEAGQMREALARLRPFLPYVRREGLVFLQMHLCLPLGRALVRSGDPRAAIPLLEEALSAATQLGASHQIADANHQLTHAYEGLRDWPAAARVADRFIATAQRSPDDGIRVISYYDAANVLWKAGWHAAADSLFRLTVAAVEREKSHYVFAADYYERIGDFGSAMRYLRLGAQRTEFGEVIDANFLYAGLTRLHLALGNTDSALVAATSHDSLQWTFDELLVPRVLVARGEYGRAITAMRRWTAFQAGRGNVRGQVKALVSLAEMLAAGGAPAEAIVVSREADSLARTHAFPLEAITAMRVRGAALTRVGQPATAVATLDSARRLALDHPDMLQRILINVALGDAQLAAGRPRSALASQRAAIGMIEQSAGTLGSDVDAARFRSVRVQAFNGALRAVLGPATPVADSVLRLSSLKKATPGMEASPGGELALRRRLAADEAMIDFVVVDSAIVATVITPAGAIVQALPATAARVLGETQRLVRPMTTVLAGRIDLSRAPFDVEASRRLYRYLIEPLADRLVSAKRLIIVPDAPLHAVPFDALVSGDSAGRPRYLVERWSVQYALTPSIRAVERRRVEAGRMLLVVADAPGSAAERDLLRAAWKGGVDVLDGKAATESNALRGRSAHAILHVTSHAKSDDADPLASYLALRADSVSDGMLHYAEIERARKRFDLVMLNACETSSGALLAGSGFMSLARAFLMSGSGMVVATQWPVGPASGNLSARFYERLRAGAAAPEALREAKLAMMRDPATAHPFYWASHVLLIGF